MHLQTEYSSLASRAREVARSQHTKAQLQDENLKETPYGIPFQDLPE
jgi:hypothetical protein